MPSANHAVIVLERSGAAPRIVPLVKKTTTIGRHVTSDVVVTEVGVSKVHAEIVETPHGHVLRNLSSLGGISINGRKLSQNEHLLKHGDVIRIGDTSVSISFRVADGLPATSPPVAMPETGKARAPVQVARGTEAASPPALEIPSELAREPREIPALPERKDESSQPAPAERYFEGTVLLDVRAEGKIESVVSFVRQVRKVPDMRFLRMVNKPGGVEIFMGLRQPIQVKVILESIPEVSRVDILPASQNAAEPCFVITLLSKV